MIARPSQSRAWCRPSPPRRPPATSIVKRRTPSAPRRAEDHDRLVSVAASEAGDNEPVLPAARTPSQQPSEPATETQEPTPRRHYAPPPPNHRDAVVGTLPLAPGSTIHDRLYITGLNGMKRRNQKAEQRAATQREREILATADDLTFKPAVYEHPTLMVHARYHYGAPLEAHDPRWHQKVQEARDRAAERPAFKARPVPRCLRRPEGQLPPRHAEEEESVGPPTTQSAASPREHQAADDVLVHSRFQMSVGQNPPDAALLHTHTPVHRHAPWSVNGWARTRRLLQCTSGLLPRVVACTANHGDRVRELRFVPPT
jgi:hypothetical protein